MAKRLILCLIVVAGVVAAELWRQVQAAEAFQDPPFETLLDAPVTEVATKQAAPLTPAPHPVPPKGTQWVERSVKVDGVIRKVMVAQEVKAEASEPAGFSPPDPQQRYLELHRQLAERLTSEQLTEKSNALEKELNELVTEDEIGQIRKQLFELKRKSGDNKGISIRLERAIESLERSHGLNDTGETFKRL